MIRCPWQPTNRFLSRAGGCLCRSNRRRVCCFRSPPKASGSTCLGFLPSNPMVDAAGSERFESSKCQNIAELLPCFCLHRTVSTTRSCALARPSSSSSGGGVHLLVLSLTSSCLAHGTTYRPDVPLTFTSAIRVQSWNFPYLKLGTWNPTTFVVPNQACGPIGRS